jgi:hypothetical protein
MESNSWRKTIGVVVRPASLSLLTLLFATVVAAYTWFLLDLNLSLSCSGPPARGANINHAIAVVFFGGLAMSGLILLVRKRRHFLLAVVLLGVAALSFAIVLVRLDSATYVQQNATCSLSTFVGRTQGSERGTAGYLYVLWGAALGMLLVQAARLLTESLRSSGNEPLKGASE